MIDVPIEPRYAPNVYLNVAYVKDGEMYTHDRLLSVPAKSKFLDIEVLADKKEYKPRETAHYTLLARNSDRLQTVLKMCFIVSVHANLAEFLQ